MKKHIVIAALAVAVLAGCNRSGGTPTAETPQVGVSNDKITINPETIKFKADQKSGKITWELPKGSAYTFPRNGISFKDGIETGNSKTAAQEFVKCTPEDNGANFSCTNLKTVKGEYKYTITLQGGAKALPPLDPIIINGE